MKWKEIEKGYWNLTCEDSVLGYFKREFRKLEAEHKELKLLLKIIKKYEKYSKTGKKPS